MRGMMKRVLKENWLVILVIGILVGGYAFLRTPGDELASTAEFNSMITEGTPTLVYFFSNT